MFQFSIIIVPEFVITFEIGQYIFNCSLILLNWFSLALHLIFIFNITSGKGTSISLIMLAPLLSNLASAVISRVSILIPCFSAILWVITFEQPINEANNVSVGVNPKLVPPLTSGSSI